MMTLRNPWQNEPATETEEKMDVDETENVKVTGADFDVIVVEEEEAPAATTGGDRAR